MAQMKLYVKKEIKAALARKEDDEDADGDKARIEELEAHIEELQKVRLKDFKAYLDLRWPEDDKMDAKEGACLHFVNGVVGNGDTPVCFAYVCEVILPSWMHDMECDKCCLEDIEHTHGTFEELHAAYEAKKHL